MSDQAACWPVGQQLDPASVRIEDDALQVNLGRNGGSGESDDRTEGLIDCKNQDEGQKKLGLGLHLNDRDGGSNDLMSPQNFVIDTRT